VVRPDVVRVVEDHQAAADGGAVPVVRLNPADVEDLRGAGLAREDVRLVADPSLARGDAIGELPGGWLDARVGEALARAREVLS